MDIPIDIKGFEGRSILLRIRFFKRPQVVLDEKIVWLINKRFTLKRNDGRAVSISLKRRFLDPIPNLVMGAEAIVAAPAHRWFTYIVLLLPLSLIPLGWFFGKLTGTLLGVPWALGTVFITSRVLRYVQDSGVKHLISGGILLGSGVTLIGSIMAISMMPRAQSVKEYEVFLKDRRIPEIHGGHHAPSSDIAADSLHLFTDKFGYPVPTTEAMDLPYLLKLGKTDLVDSFLTHYQRLFEQEIRYENFVARAFWLFDEPDSSMEVLFSRWIERQPTSFAAREARAHYYYGLGYANRGTKWASETTEEQFAGMEFFFDKAEEDARTALILEPRLLIAYELLMDIARARGDSYVASLLMEQATKLCPCSYRIRECFMFNLLPRWGGSYKAMDEFAEECEKLADENPRLKLLRGYEPWDRGTMCIHEEKYDEALQYFAEALSYGEHQSFLKDRGRVYWIKNQYTEALADFEKALTYNPFDAEIMLNAARMDCFLNRFPEAVKNMGQVERIAPKNEDLRDFKEWAGQHLVYEGYQLYKKQEYEAAIDFYSWATTFDAGNAEAYYYRGAAKIRVEQLESAEADFKEALKLNPTDEHSRQMLDWISQARQ